MKDMKDMKVLVCGSIGYGEKERIREVQEILRGYGYQVLDQLTFDYSTVEDFRDRSELSEEIVRRDLELVDKADVVVLLADTPSFGAMAEAITASLKGKTVIAYSPNKMRSPWPAYFSQKLVRSVEELIEELNSIAQNEIRTIPNIYGKVELELVCPFTCICPVTGVRDYSTAYIRYIPRDRILEYENLQKYFGNFRDKVMHHEAVARRVFQDVSRALEPEKLEVMLEFEERNGVKARVKIESGRD